MPSEVLKYYATDKELFDVLASSRQRLSESALLEIARARGLFYSPRESREVLASNISLLPHDFESLRELLGQSENPSRAEKVTSITLNKKLSASELKQVAQSFAESAPKDEKVISHADGPDKYVVQVKYSEIDYGKTRLLQRRTREADIRFVVEGDQTTIRMPANAKAREIASQLKNGLDALQSDKIQSEVIEITELPPDDRTAFFTSLITRMAGYELQDVTNVRVQSGGQQTAESEAEEDEEGDEQDKAIESRRMLAVVENVALHGQVLLASSEYQLLRKKGFYITSITWKSKQTSTPYNVLEFDAGFEEPKDGRGFRYNVRGLYRNRDGEFTKTLRGLSDEHKESVFPLIEKAALSVLSELREKSATTAPLDIAKAQEEKS